MYEQIDENIHYLLDFTHRAEYVYFNPDSSDGGELVYIYANAEDITAPERITYEGNEHLSSLEGICYSEYVKVSDPSFQNCLTSCKENSLYVAPDAKALSEKIKSLATEYLKEQENLLEP